MFSKEEVKARIDEFKGMLEKDGIIMPDYDGDTIDLTGMLEKEKIMSDYDGVTVDLTVHGEVVHMWFDFMGINSSLSPDEGLRLTDGNDAKWYALACYLEDIIHDLKHENKTLKAQIKELEEINDRLRVQIDDMEAEDMVESIADIIDREHEEGIY